MAGRKVTPARLIIDAPHAAAANMAIDEALLVSAGHSGAATLRFYQWREPSLSLGYFQPVAARQSHAGSRACDIVRRATGGGAIVHHHELTYSFVAPIADRLAANVERLYYDFHETLIAALAALGVPAALCEVPVATSPGDEPFLCFERRSRGDVLLPGYKIGGSAQRRHHGAVLQHGSILLAQSAFAPELPGIADISRVAISPRALIEHWQPLLSQRLQATFSSGRLSPSEEALAAELQASKFTAPAWTQRR